MKWNQHKGLEGSHAFLSASKYQWRNKEPEELIESYKNSFAVSIGTAIHAYAADCIRYMEKLKKGDAHLVKLELLRKGFPEFAIDIDFIFPTLMRYVNDAVSFQMDPEILLYHSDLCYGTADAIQCYNNELRIYDLKTGVTPAKMDQLMIYAGLFYLEYAFRPENTKTVLRIYQSGEVDTYEPEPEEIHAVIEDIVNGVRAIKDFKGV